MKERTKEEEGLQLLHSIRIETRRIGYELQALGLTQAHEFTLIFYTMRSVADPPCEAARLTRSPGTRACELTGRHDPNRKHCTVCGGRSIARKYATDCSRW